MTVMPFRSCPVLAGAVPVILGATLSEAFSPRLLDGAAGGFVLAMLGHTGSPAARGTVLWAQDHLSRREAGLPCLAGIGRSLLRVDVPRAVDVLAAMEDGLAARMPVVGEVYGAPAAVDFTATRRLAMRAEAAGVPCWLIRHGAQPDASAARQRWLVEAAPSAPHPDDPLSPGDPRWRVELFRSRMARPGVWSVTHDRTKDRVRFSALAGDGALAARDRPQQRAVPG